MEISANPFVHLKDFPYIIGNEQAKQTLEIAAAGERNILMAVHLVVEKVSLLEPSHRFSFL
jgi:predicted ATPase with chaperone activity